MSSSKSKLAVISRDAHINRRWRRPTTYKFAAGDAVVPLVVPEVMKAAANFPIGFLKAGESVRLVGLFGLQPGQNLYVAADGRWFGNYIPAVFRTYPFRLADNGAGGFVACVIEDEAILTNGPDGERFFADDEGKSLSPGVNATLEVLRQVAGVEQMTAVACTLLQKHQLLVPWRFRRADDKVYTMGDVLTVDEAALNGLSAEALVEMRSGWALPLAYAQLLSQQHVATLVALEAAHAKRQAQVAAAASGIVNPKGELDLEFLNQSATLDFRDLK